MTVDFSLKRKEQCKTGQVRPFFLTKPKIKQQPKRRLKVESGDVTQNQTLLGCQFGGEVSKQALIET